MILHDFFKLNRIPQYTSLDFNGMIIDGNNIFNEKRVKALFEMNNSLTINIYNAVFTNHHKPIFSFKPRSLIKIINCSIIDSTFNFIPESIAISSSQIKFFNFTIRNVIFNRSSLITSFQSLTEMIDINISSSSFLDCSLINNIDETFSFNKFTIINCNGLTSNIFDSVGTVYFIANNFLSYNLSFSNNFLYSSFIFHSDFSLELFIENFSMLFNTGISVFNETCKKFSLNNGIITNSYFNKYIIKAIKSGRIYLINTDIRDCICQSILDINECSSFILLNSTINNITNTNSINLQNDSKTASSIFTFSKVSSKISIEKSNFLNIFNQNTFIFSIYNSNYTM